MSELFSDLSPVGAPKRGPHSWHAGFRWVRKPMGEVVLQSYCEPLKQWIDVPFVGNDPAYPDGVFSQ